MSKCLQIASVQFLGTLACPSQASARSSQEREMSNSFVGNLDIVPGNKNVYPAVVVRSTSGPFEQFQVDIEH